MTTDAQGISNAISEAAEKIRERSVRTRGMKDISAHDLIMFANEAEAVREASYVPGRSDIDFSVGHYSKSYEAAAFEVTAKHGLEEEIAYFIFGLIFHSWNEVNDFGMRHNARQG